MGASEIVDSAATYANEREFAQLREDSWMNWDSRPMSLTRASPEELISGHGHRWFYVACAAEASLVPVAAILGHFFHHPPWAYCRWSWTDLLVGLVAGLPPFFLFLGMLKSRSGALADVRQAMEETVRPLFAHWSILQLALISLLAGVGEEWLFRGFIQPALGGMIGPAWALVVTSLLFGCVHPITLNYALVTAGVGVYLGGLMMFSGNLLTPIVAHAAYDFAALVYFLRVYRPAADGFWSSEPP